MSGDIVNLDKYWYLKMIIHSLIAKINFLFKPNKKSYNILNFAWIFETSIHTKCSLGA